MKAIEKLFGFNPETMTLRTEITAGFTTFMTMCYILAVNPTILSSSGMDKGALFTATVLGATFGTLLMAFYAKLPFAQAPSMGANAFFAFTLCQVMGFSWQEALAAILIEGVIFLVITFFNIREMILNSIPRNLRLGISTGIGMFITFIGLQNAGIIVDNPATLVSLGAFTPHSILGVIAILLSAGLMARRVKGALFISIVIVTLIGIPLGETRFSDGWQPLAMPQSVAPIFCKFDFSSIFSLKMAVVIISLLYVDIFDTIGTLIGVTTKAGMVRADGTIPRINKAMISDATATVAGAFLGTSTVTTFVESAAGIAEGGRSGVTSFTTGLLFLLSLFLSPLFLVIPSSATCGALVMVGVLMISSIKDIAMDDVSEAFPVFITIVMMVLSYSISEGICMGLISYTFIKLFTGQRKDLTTTLYVLTALFLLKYIFG